VADAVVKVRLIGAMGEQHAMSAMATLRLCGTFPLLNYFAAA